MTSPAPQPAESYAMNLRIRESIAEFMNPATAVTSTDAWMRSPFKGGPLVGRSPLGLINEGRGQDVLDFIDAMRDGVFM